jgi:hypothetical protein
MDDLPVTISAFLPTGFKYFPMMLILPGPKYILVGSWKSNGSIKPPFIVLKDQTSISLTCEWHLL